MKKWISVGIVISMIVMSCSGLKEVECKNIKGFKIHKVSTEGINSDVMLTIKNPNDFGFYVLPSSFTVTYSGIKLGTAKLEKKVYIPKNTEESYAFNMAGDFKDITLGDIMKALEGFSRKGEVGVKGNLKVGKFLVKKSIPVELKERILAE